MQIILPEMRVTMPWRNGGGITHELLRLETGGTLLIRLSIAEVASDGPFSSFPGLMRILTVLRGAGLVLRTPEGAIEATPLAPVRFSGDLPVECSRIAGDVTDFNVIFDPARIDAQVMRLQGPEEWRATGPAAFLCLSGAVQAEGQPVFPGTLVHAPSSLALGEGAQGLLVRFAEV